MKKSNSKYSDFTPSTKEVLSCLLIEKPWLKILKDRNKPYEIVLDYLIQLAKYEDENEKHCPEKRQQNVISKQLSLPVSKVKSWIFQIYEDLFQLNFDEPDLFNCSGYTFLYQLSFESLFGHACFNLWLPCELKRFDTFYFPFISGKLDFDCFWVKEIFYEHRNGKIECNASLKYGLYNQYREFKIAEMEFYGYLSYREKYSLSEVEIDKLIWKYK